MVWAERRGMPRMWLGPVFLFASVMVYAVILAVLLGWRVMRRGGFLAMWRVR